MSDLKFKDASVIVDEARDRIEKYIAAKGRIPGMSTGFDCVNAQTGGLERTKLSILAARAGMGKTAMAGDIAVNVAAESGPVVIFSLEMRASDFALRRACSKAGVDGMRLRRGLVTKDERARIDEALAAYRELPIYVCDSGKVTPASFERAVRELVVKHEAKLVITDHVQLMEADQEKKGMNRTQEITVISRAMKQVAMDLNIHVMALSQLNRELEKRVDKRPQLSDLRESGSLEQDADIVLMLYREEVYSRDFCPPAQRHVCEVIAAKAREGKSDSVSRLLFVPEFTGFYEAGWVKQAASHAVKNGKSAAAGEARNEELPWGEI